MDAQQFVADFATIVSAQDGVQRIRQMIYNLAISGYLTQQLPDDGEAETLLQDIHDLRNHLIRKKMFKRSRKFDRQSQLVPGKSEIQLPRSWCWSRLVDIGEISPKNNVTEDDIIASFIPMSGVSDRHSSQLLAEARPWKQIKSGFTHFADGDVVVAKITPSFENGKAAVISGLINGIGAGTTELHVVRPLRDFVESAYIYIFLRSPFFAAVGEKYMTGTAGQKRLPTEYFATRSFPLPPIAEQKRIVAKVDELMALCDRLEAQQQERDVLRRVTSSTVFRSLGDAITSSEISDAWHRIEKYGQFLLNDLDGIQDLRGAILDLAVSGRLIPSNKSNNSTGAMLLEEIATRRAEWAKNTKGQERQEAIRLRKKIERQRIVMPSANVPEHWAWGSFLQISQAVVDCHNKTAPYVPEGIHLVRTSDIRNGAMDLSQTRKITEDTYAYWARRLPPKPGDLFFTREAPMGEAAIVPEGTKVCLGQRIMLVRVFPDLFSHRFLLYVVYSPSFRERMTEAAIGMTVKHLRVGDVEDLMVPVPPRVEQDRIVDSVDELFAICDGLERRIQELRQIATELSKASVEVITGVYTEEQQKLKIPKTELISTLRIGAETQIRETGTLTEILANNDGELPAKTLWNLSGLEIDVFYQKLKTEMTKGWIIQPEVAYVKEEEAS